MRSIDKVLENETYQLIHRTINTLLMVVVVTIGYQQIVPIYEDISGIKAEQQAEIQRLKQLRIIESEISQIIEDEGYRAKPYKDTRGLWTIGFGHLIKEGEDFTTVTPHYAVKMLRKDYKYASDSVQRKYPWAVGEVKLVLINMTYQMGENGVSKFQNAISSLKGQDYDSAAAEMLNSRWAKQTPLRASRLAGRIMQLY